MLRAGQEAVPAEPTFPHNLLNLGYKVNDKNQIVDYGTKGEFVDYYVSSDERMNEVHKEAVHVCVREEVRKQLQEQFGVMEVYLSGDGANVHEVSETKPTGKHIKMYATELRVLMEKKDVVVVIGEHNQDLGVWAWRLTMAEGGIDAGTAVGLMKKLDTKKFNIDSNQNRIVNGMSDDDPLQDTMSKLDIDDATGVGNEVSGRMSRMPGVVILNPGQLLYSHVENACMTQASWFARKRMNAIAEHYLIHTGHNRVPGHANPAEHVGTVFGHILSKMLREDANLYVVGMTDGAENFINYVNQNDTRHMVEGMVFMNPTHDPRVIDSPNWQSELETYGRSWVKSSQPMDQFLNAPGAFRRFSHIDEEDAASIEPFVDEDPIARAETEHHRNQVVSFPTKSGGTDIDELIFPTVMDKALEWLKFRADLRSSTAIPHVETYTLEDDEED